MKARLFLAFSLLTLAVSMTAWGQKPAYNIQGDWVFRMGKRQFNSVGDNQPVQDADLDLKTSRSVSPFPAPPHPAQVAASWQAYQAGNFPLAITLVDSLAHQEPADPPVLDAYPRALYRNPGTRAQSYPVYQRLIRLLDAYGREDPETTSIYLLFFESYFKLGTLQLDAEQWSDASYNLSRAAFALGSVGSARVDNPGMIEQILQYQTECFAHLNQPELCRYFGQRTLRLFPRNQYVKPYLAALTKPKPRQR